LIEENHKEFRAFAALRGVAIEAVAAIVRAKIGRRGRMGTPAVRRP
jgi:hypothetical protein